MKRNTRMMLLNKRRMGYDNNYDTYGYDEEYRRYNDTENRFRDRRGREHYDNGRYAPKRNEYRNEYRYDYDDDYEYRPRNIGFNMGGYDEPRNGMRLHYGGKGMEHGGASGGDFTEEDAEEWVSGMKNADGTAGEHWSMQQVKQLINQRKLKLDPVDLYIALNATYSDLCTFFKKYNINNMDAYIDYAKMFWLEDEDAVDDKMAAYYMYVVK